VAIKFGTKAWTVVGTAVFALALVAGCNTEEAAPVGGAAPSKAPGAAPPGKAPEIKTPTPTPTPPVSTPKEEGKPK